MALDKDAKRFAELLFAAGETYDQVVVHFATQWQISKAKARESLKDLGYQPPPTDAQRRRAGAGVDREERQREQEGRRANKKQMEATLRAFRERERQEDAQRKKEEKDAARAQARLERERVRHEEAMRKNSLRHIAGDEIKRTIKSNVIKFLGEFGVIGRVATRRMFGSRYRDQHGTPREARREASQSVDAQAAPPVVSALQLLTRRVDHAGSRIVVALTDVRHEIEKTAKRASRPPAANSLGASVYAEKYGATGMGMGADKSALFRMMTGGLSGGKLKAALGIAGVAGIGALALSSTPAQGALHPSDDMARDRQPPQALPPDREPPQQQALPPDQPGVEQKDTGAVSDRADVLKYESREIKFEADTIEFEQTGVSPGAAEEGGAQGGTSATPTQTPPAVQGGAAPGAPASPSQTAPSAPGTQGALPTTAMPPTAIPSGGGGQSSPQADVPSVSAGSRPPMTGSAAATGDRGLFGSNPAMIPPSSARLDTSRTGARDAFSDQLKQEGGQYQDPKAVASAFIGNAVQESGLNPRLSHDRGTGYGMFGHRLDRRDAMFKWLQDNGYSRDSAEGQARYAAHEFQTRKEYAGLRQRAANITGKDVPDFARDVSRTYERPSPRWANEERRAREAATTYDADEKAKPQASRDDAKTRSDGLTPEALTSSVKKRDDAATRVDTPPPEAPRDTFTQRFGEEPVESLKSRLDAAVLDTERSPAARHPEWTVGDLRKTPAAEAPEPSKRWSMEDRFVGGEDPPPATSKRDAFDSGSFPGLGRAQVDPHHGIGQ